MIVQRGKFHAYLGTDFGYSDSGVVKLSTNQYLQMVLDKLPGYLKGIFSTPT